MLYTTQSFLNTFRSKVIIYAPIILFISNTFHACTTWNCNLRKKILSLKLESRMEQNNWLWNKWLAFKIKLSEFSSAFQLSLPTYHLHCLDWERMIEASFSQQSYKKHFLETILFFEHGHSTFSTSNYQFLLSNAILLF